MSKKNPAIPFDTIKYFIDCKKGQAADKIVNKILEVKPELLFPVFEIDCDGPGQYTVIKMNDEILNGVIDVSVTQHFSAHPVVTISFHAKDLTWIKTSSQVVSEPVRDGWDKTFLDCEGTGDLGNIWTVKDVLKFIDTIYPDVTSDEVKAQIDTWVACGIIYKRGKSRYSSSPPKKEQ